MLKYVKNVIILNKVLIVLNLFVYLHHETATELNLQKLAIMTTTKYYYLNGKKYKSLEEYVIARDAFLAYENEQEKAYKNDPEAFKFKSIGIPE